jgi:hypothetical protein
MPCEGDADQNFTYWIEAGIAVIEIGKALFPPATILVAFLSLFFLSETAQLKE